MNEREIFTSDATVVQVDEQDPQQMQVSPQHIVLLTGRAIIAGSHISSGGSS